nr:hypothetical protein Iba_chr13dCG9410 [Ipomoea batatas]
MNPQEIFIWKHDCFFPLSFSPGVISVVIQQNRYYQNFDFQAVGACSSMTSASLSRSSMDFNLIKQVRATTLSLRCITAIWNIVTMEFFCIFVLMPGYSSALSSTLPTSLRMRMVGLDSRVPLLTPSLHLIES